MSENARGAPNSAPVVTEAQLKELKAKLAASGREPILPTGTRTACATCGGEMLSTNDLERTVATPGLVYVVTRLPGARCMTCEATELDGAGVAILETTVPRGLWADYETAVTHASGTTLGTYFKMDLVRVLGLSGVERLSWKVIDRDRALVQVERETSRLRAHPAATRGSGGRGSGHSTGQVRRRRPVKAES